MLGRAFQRASRSRRIPSPTSSSPKHAVNFRLCFSTTFSPLASPKRTQNKDNIRVHSSIREHTAGISKSLSEIDAYADWKSMQEEIEKLESSLADEKAWDNAVAALKTNNRLGHLRKQISTYQKLKDIASDLQDLTELAEESVDTQMQEELLPELEVLRDRLAEYLTSLRLSEPVDINPAYIDIRAGSGGTEACDWASMLARMYTRWAHSRDYTVEIVDESLGDVAGIKGTTILVNGPYAYGYAQYETGVHRLVRISPFDQAGARHTSFASVRVTPYFDEDTSDVGIELNPSDLKITTMRSQGAGGQHVNKTESAVRIVHIPTGLTVACQQERSQHRNRTLALSLLKSRLYEMERQKRAQSKVDAHNTLPENAWGSQIRSYVLQPYQLIKDARTGYEVGTGGAQKVLDGDVGEFMEASLRHFRKRPHCVNYSG